MSETRKIAAILVADVVGYEADSLVFDEDRTLVARLRGLRSDLIGPAIAAHHGRVVKRTGDGSRPSSLPSVVDAVRCAIEVQNGMVERNAGLRPERRIEFRIGIHLGDVVEESDGDLMGDGVNIAARLEAIAAPGAICLSEDAYRQVKGRASNSRSRDLGPYATQEHCRPDLEFAHCRSAFPRKRGPRRRLPLQRRRGVSQTWRALRLGDHGIDHCDDRRSGGSWARTGRPLSRQKRQRRSHRTERGPLPEVGHLSIVVLPFANLSKRPEPGLLRRWNYGRA